MTVDEKEIKRKRRILDHADKSGNVAKTCRYFGIPRSLFYVWRNAYRQHGDEGLKFGYRICPLSPGKQSYSRKG
jgi:hypothetical protein